jgi:aldose 1-epimerase
MTESHLTPATSRLAGEPPADLWLRQPDAIAAFTPSLGFACTAYRARVGDEWLPILNEPPTWDALRARPAFYGNPLMFPYPYGMTDDAFTYRGTRYTLKPGLAGRVQHGLVRDHAWLLERTWSDAEGDHVRASIANAGHADRLAEFPLPFVLRVTQTLLGRNLSLAFEAENSGDSPMPIGLAIHPYFPLPFRPGGVVADTIVRADVTHLAEVAPDHTGVTYRQPPPSLDLTDGRRADDILRANPRAPANQALLLSYQRRPEGEDSGEIATGGVTYSIEDVRSGARVTIESSADFQSMVLFAPADHSVISPVISTCLPDAFNLRERGHPAGTIELAPGETWRGWTRFIVSSA